MKNIRAWSQAPLDRESYEAESAPKAKKGKEKGGALERILQTFLDKEKHRSSGP